MNRAARTVRVTSLLLPLALLALAACTTSADPTPSPTPTFEVAPTPEATHTPAPATATTPPTPAPRATFIAGEHTLDGIELLILSVPYSEYFPTHQFPDRLDRVYQGDDGEIHVETLLTAAMLGDLPFVLSLQPVVVSPSGWELATTVCVHGDCGGFRPPSEDAITALYQSTDGGRTWEHDADLEGGVRALGWLDGEIVLSTAAPSSDDSPPSEQPLRVYPSDRPLVVPDGASSRYAAPSVFDSPYGPLWSATNGRSLIDASGAPVIEFPGRSDQQPAGVALLLDDTVFWNWTGPNRTGAQFGALFDTTGTQLTPTLQVGYGCCTTTPDGRLLVPGVAPLAEWIDEYSEELPAMQDGAPYRRAIPGFLDPATGAIEAITDPFLRAAYQDRDEIRILAVLPASPR